MRKEREEREVMSTEEFTTTIRALGPLNGLTAEGWAEYLRVFEACKPWEDPKFDMLGIFREVVQKETV